MTRAVLDRIDEGVAVLATDAGEVRLPAALLPRGAKEGAVLELSLAYDPKATQKARERTAKARGALSRGDDGGDIEL